MLHLWLSLGKNYTIGMKRKHLPDTGSTNAVLREWLMQGKIQPPAVLRADYQLSGKGQSGNSWRGDPGKNLLISFLLHPAFLSASEQFMLSKVAALALFELLRDLELNPVIKWPNDLLLEEKKLAGILIEHGISGTEIKHSIIGIGLNVNQEVFPVFPRPATSLILEGKKKQKPEDLALVLEEKLMEGCRLLEEGGAEQINAHYLEHLYGRGQVLPFSSAGREFTGIIRGIGAFGHLLVEQDETLMEYGMQEISFLPQ